MSFFQWPEDGQGRVEQPYEVPSDVGGAEVGGAEDGSLPPSPPVLQRIVRFVGLSLSGAPFPILLAQFQVIVRPLGIAHITLVDLSRFDTCSMNGLCFTTFPLDAVMQFTKGQRWRDDPVLIASRVTERILRWSDVVADAAKRSPAANAEIFFEDQDLADGLTLPLSVQGFGRPVMFLAANRRLELDDGVQEALQVASAVLAVHAPRPEEWGRKAPGLTARERQILSRAASGRNTREIGRDLDMSEGTVARHLSNIRGKLGAANTVQAVVMALRRNEVDV